MDNAAALGRADQGPVATGRTPHGSWATRRRLRIMPWRGDVTCMLIGPARGTRRPQPGDIRRAVDELRSQGVTRFVTPAMNRYEAEAFHQAGFTHLESLHLLLCRLNQMRLPPKPDGDSAITLATGRRRHLDEMLAVDGRAFAGFWQFDRTALNEARTATPSQLSRRAVATIDGQRRTVGYAVTGKARNRGYLQRLAVDPAAQSRGIGTLLVHDAFRWLSRRGADTCLVNTQETNHRALALYEHLGFERQSEGLVVLRWDTVP